MVAEVVSPTAVRLSGFPSSWKGHPVINVSRLRPYVDGEELFPGRQAAEAPPVDLELDSDEPIFDSVLHFVARRRDPSSRTRMVLVRWRDDRLDSWNSEAELRQWCVDATGNTSRFRELYKILA